MGYHGGPVMIIRGAMVGQPAAKDAQWSGYFTGNGLVQGPEGSVVAAFISKKVAIEERLLSANPKPRMAYFGPTH